MWTWKNNIVFSRSLCAALLGALAASPPAAAGGGLDRWKLEFGLSSLYDGNILRYSDKYLDRFAHKQDAGRFHIATRDDLILTNSIRATAVFDFVSNATTSVAMDFRHRMYAQNGVKDWSYYGISLRQGLGKRMSAGLGYHYIPEFYTRHYRDEDWVQRYQDSSITFQPFEYKKDEMAAWLQRAFFKSTAVRVSASYGRYFYNQHFTEYNSRNKQAGVEISHPLDATLRLTGNYDFLSSEAQGNDEADPSFEEDNVALRISWQPPALLGRMNRVIAGGEYARRCFRSRIPPDVDRLHAGRIDHDVRLFIEWSTQFSPRLFFTVAYAWQMRDAETSAKLNATYISDEKDYHQHQIGIEAKYVLNFFANDDAESEGDL